MIIFKFEYRVAGWHRVYPWHRHVLIELVSGSRSEEREVCKHKRNSLRLQDGVAIGHLQVQMGAGGVAAVSEERERVALMNMIM